MLCFYIYLKFLDTYSFSLIIYYLVNVFMDVGRIFVCRQEF
jgi:hypothetical protein